MPPQRIYSEEEITAGLMAMVAWAGNAAAASRYLKAEKEIDITQATLNHWKVVHGPRLDELREKFSQQMEASLAHEFRDVARLAIEAQRLAIEQATERLESGEDKDPGRTAANLAGVSQRATDKLMTVTARPTVISETRGVQEILRGLIALNVLKPPELPESTDGESTDADS